MQRIFLIVLFAHLFLFETKAQSKDSSRTIYNSDFKWTVVIPAGFDTVSAEVWAKMQKKGSDAIEKTYDKKVENNATPIFVFQNNQFNYFESNYQPFDTITDGDFLQSFQTVNTM